MKQMSFEDTIKKELKGVKKNVYDLLVKYPKLRNSDRELIWQYWDEIDKLTSIYHFYINREIYVNYLKEKNSDIAISKDNFLRATHPESIRRMAALIRSEYPELKGDEFSRKGRIIKEEVFKEECSSG